ncbi:MAG: RagB/SusD family nutrient uptake outer membrane protein [Ginsengibacter sp.]
MKRALNIYLLLTFVVMLQMSCNKSWLKPDPLSTLTPENVYTDEAGFQSLIVTLRKNLKKEMYDGRNLFAQEQAASDLAIPIFQIDFSKLTPSSDNFWKFLSLFTTSYGCIKDANVLISRIDGIKWANEQKRNIILGEAYWHRAYWYYRLVNSYGDVPWIGNEVQNAKLDFATNSRWAILDKLQSDMEFAVQWLPEKAPAGAISKGAGNMLLTKISLADGNFDKAIAAATAVINGPYALMKQRFGIDANNSGGNVIWDLHRPDNMNIPQNTETILATVDRFEAPPGAKTTGTSSMRLYNCAAAYNSIVKDSQGKPGTIAAGGQYDTLGRGNCDVRLDPFYEYDVWAFENHTWKNTPDLRRSDFNWTDIDEIYYSNPASVDYMKPINPKWFASPNDTLQGAYAMPTYITYVKQQNPTATPLGGNGDWYIFRLAEAYLLRAEAYIYKNEPGLAANDINTVRERSHALPISAGKATIDFIFDERARELFAESPRHSELVRASYIMAKLNMGGYSLNNFSQKNYYYDRVMDKNIFYKQGILFYANTISMKPYNVLWPILSTVITANTLGVINQNIGYDGADKNIPPITTPIE